MYSQATGLFIENKGQWPSDVSFRTQMPGGSMYLTDKGITYAFYSQEKVASFHDHHTTSPATRTTVSPESGDRVPMHSLEMEFVGGSPAGYSGQQAATSLFNYFRGNNPAKWGKGALGYSHIDVERIYDGVGARFYSVAGGESAVDLKYDLLVAPGADPGIIKMRYRGASSMEILGEQLMVNTSVNRLVESRPVAYQLEEGDTTYIPCRFTLNGEVAGFEFPRGYNRNLPLVIDPILIFSTFSGSTADNWGFTATFDDEGKFYSGGIVFDTSFPTTPGAYSVNFSGFIDVGILKYDSLGSTLEYATYIGASEMETPHSLIVDNAGNLLILGATGSSDFPLSATAYQSTYKGGTFTTPLSGITFANGSDVFIAKLSNDGTELLASTYLGGSNLDCLMNPNIPLARNYGDEFRGEIYNDEANNIYIATSTASDDFFGEYTPSATFGGNYDGVVVKLDPDLSSVLWGTYIGGSGYDGAFALRTDTSGNIYAAGGSNSEGLPFTGLNKTLSGELDGWVARFDPEADSLLAGTYLGTPSYDQVYLMDQDANMNIYVLGQTKGRYPVAGNTYRNSLAGQFLHKLTPELDSTLFSTTIGRTNTTGTINPDFRPTAFLVNDCDLIYISGWGGPNINGRVPNYVLSSRNMSGLPVTSDARQLITDENDFYLMVLGQEADRLLYATFFGGAGQDDHVDGGTSRFDKRGIVYQSVCAGCGGTSNFPTTDGAWSRTNQSANCNNAAFKFDLATLDARFEVDPQEGCSPLTVKFKNTSVGGKNFLWDFGNGQTYIGRNPPSMTYTDAGQYTVVLVIDDEQTCAITSRDQKTITVYEGDFTMPEDREICLGEQTILKASGATEYLWSPAEGLNNPRGSSPVASPDTTTLYIL
ncbi:MAG: PKD domain-containing protein, partial [Cyclobacteriaceae bacterium]